LIEKSEKGVKFISLIKHVSLLILIGAKT